MIFLKSADTITNRSLLNEDMRESLSIILVASVYNVVDAGVVFVGELKKQNNTVPIYLMSSAGDSFDSSTNYTELGFSGVLQKPIDPTQLLDIVNKKLR